MNESVRKRAVNSPILIVPYMWIGDFVRCHSVVKLLRERFPDRPIDMLATTLCAPLTDYMPGVRKAVVVDLPRRRIAFAKQSVLANRLKQEGYGTALVMPRTWKSALAPFLAGIPERIGFAGEARFFLLNDLRYGERRLPRMIDRCAALTLPPHARLPRNGRCPNCEFPATRLRHGATRADSTAIPAQSLRSRREPSAPQNAGRAQITRRSPAASLPRALRSGCSAARTKKHWRRRLSAIPRPAI